MKKVAVATNESARRVLRILLAFSQKNPRLTIEDLTKRAGVPKSSAYRHVALLRDMGFVDDDGHGVYQLSVRTFLLSEAARAAEGALNVARPIMEKLRDSSRETVLLYKRVRRSAVCIDLCESVDPIRLSSSIGAKFPLDRGAMTRVLLAHMETGGHPGARRRDSERQNDGVCEADLERIRRDGYAVSVGELSPDVWAVAAPVYDKDRVIYSLTIAGPAYRLDKARQDDLKTLVSRGAQEVSRILSKSGRGISFS